MLTISKRMWQGSGTARSVLSVFTLLQGVYTIVPVIPDAQLQIQNVNICEDEASFRCQDGELLSVVDVTCGYDGGACPETTKRTIESLCGGQQTCSNAGLRKLLAPVACISPIHIGYQCKPGTTPVCHANICAPASNGLICPSGNVIHVRHMTCLTPTTAGECPRSSYSTLFMCEGAGHCDASGLRDLLPHLCPQPGDVTGRAVLVEYFCVPESQVDVSCSTSRYHRLKGSFGVIRPPRLDAEHAQIDFQEEAGGADPTVSTLPPTVSTPDSEGNGGSSNSGGQKNKKNSPLRCKWLINPRDVKIEVRVHQLTSTSRTAPTSSGAATASFSSSSSLCPELGLLSIKYKDCEAGNATKIVTLCADGEELSSSEGRQHQTAPMQVVSCGMIQITSSVPGEDESQAAVDKLIVSYHKVASSPNEDIPIGISTCPAPPVVIPTEASSTAAFDVDLTGVPGPPYGPAAPSSISKKFGQSDGPRASPGDGNAVQDGTNNSSTRFPNFKLLILYIIFGIIILALLIALIVVIVSYRRISVRKKRGQSDFSERTALWLYPRHEDTPLETFQTNSLADGTASMTPESESSHRKVIASVHHGPDTTRTSTGSGMSSFLSGPSNPADNDRESNGLKDLITTFQSGTFGGYSSLRDLCGHTRLSTGSLDARGEGTEFELTDSAPAVIGGGPAFGKNCDAADIDTCHLACDEGPLYVSGGSGQYAGVGSSEDKPEGTGEHQEINHYASCNGGGHYTSPIGDGPYASLNDDGGLYSSPGDGGHYADPNSGDYANPSSGHYEGIGGDSGHYESSGGNASGHYESLPCVDSNIYEAIEPGRERGKKHSRPMKYSSTAAATTNTNHRQHPPLPPPIPAPMSNGGPNHTPLDDFHYRVNNDDYAVVRKPNRQSQPSAISSSKSTFASLGGASDQHQGLTNGDSCNNYSNVGFYGSDSPQTQVTDQNWKRRSAPVANNYGWTQGDQWEDAV